MKITPDNITSLGTHGVFVFGSNLNGMHIGGAALAAVKWGAIPTIGEGLQGQTYALPTKDYNLNTRTLPDIYDSVIRLLQCVEQNPDKLFMVTKVGCGLAGLTVEQVAPMFRQFLDLDNVSLPQEFIDFLTCAE